MKKVKFVRMKSETVSVLGFKGSKYKFEGIEEIIKTRLLDGWEYLGYVPVITRTTGDIETLSLIFERDE